MATDLETLVVRLEAQVRGYEREMQRARSSTENAMRRIEGRTTAASSRVSKNMAQLGSAVSGGFARLAVIAGGALGADQIRRYADEYTKIQNALKITGLEGDKLAATYGQLFAAAQRQSAPLESMVQLYSRMSLSQKELNASQPEMLRFTEGVGLALKVQGTSAKEASGALLQLSQALGGGKIQAEEFNSLIDGAPVLLRAAAAGLKEAGGSTAELTRLVKDGQVSSEAFFRAFLAGLPQIERMADSTGSTTSQALQKIENAFVNLIGEMDKVTGTSATVGSALGQVASVFENVAARILESAKAISAYRAQLGGAGKDLANFANQARLTELNNYFNRNPNANREKGVAAALSREQEDLIEINRRAQQAGMLGRGKPAPEVEQKVVVKPVPEIKPVSIKDFPVEPAGGGKAARGGGGGSSAEKVNEYQREIEAIQKRTEALRLEQQTIGLSAGEAAKAEAAHRLLNAAKEAGIAITPQMQADIARESALYGEQTQKLHDLEAAHREVKRAIEDFRGAAQEGVSTFISDLREGKSAAEALKNALDRVVDRLLDMALNAAFDGLFGGGKGGGLLSSLLGGARASGGPVQSGKTYLVGENGPEMVRFGRNGTVVPNSVVKTGAGAPQTVDNSRVFQIDARGAQIGVAEQIEARLRAYDANINRTLPQRMKVSGARFG